MYLKRKTGVRNNAKTLNYFAYAVFPHADFFPIENDLANTHHIRT